MGSGYPYYQTYHNSVSLQKLMNRLNKLVILTLTFALLTACSTTKPPPRCTDDFKPINPDTVVPRS